MAITAYVDDSGSSKKEPIYVLGGLVLPDEYWELLVEDWKAALNADPPIEYFKASEVWDRDKGPFRNFDTAQRMKKVETLADVILTYRPLSLSCRLEWATYRSFREKVDVDPSIDDPYFFLYHAIIAQMAIFGADRNLCMKANFVFDNQNGLGERVRKVWAFFLQSYTEELRSRMGDDLPEFDDEKNCLPLQAADLFAWYQRRSALNSLGHESHVRIWERFCNDHRRFSVIVSEENLVRITTILNGCIEQNENFG